MNKFIALGQGGECKPPAKRKRDDDSSDDEWLRVPIFKKKSEKSAKTVGFVIKNNFLSMQLTL